MFIVAEDVITNFSWLKNCSRKQRIYKPLVYEKQHAKMFSAANFLSLEKGLGIQRIKNTPFEVKLRETY